MQRLTLTRISAERERTNITDQMEAVSQVGERLDVDLYERYVPLTLSLSILTRFAYETLLMMLSNCAR